jgi:hypothetical protein
VNRWTSRIVALALLWIVVPGAIEATENLAHLLDSGHLAHAAESGDSHSEPGPEHGCNATFHLCSCHAAPSGLPADAAVAAASEPAAPLVARLAERTCAGHRHNIEHPPQF